MSFVSRIVSLSKRPSVISGGSIGCYEFAFICRQAQALPQNQAMAVVAALPQARCQFHHQRRFASVKTDTIDWKPMKTQRQLNKATQPKRGKSVVLTLLCLTPIVTLFLGLWQMRRLKWKNNLVAECEDRLTYRPLQLPKGIMPEDVPDYEYRKVLVTGKFDFENEMLVGPRLHNGERGYLLVTPFIRSSDGQKIIIDRGWIHESKVDPRNRRLKYLSIPEGEMTVECLLRVAPKKEMFHIDHDVNSTEVFRYVDLDVMAKRTGSLPIYAQVVQDFNTHPERLSTTTPVVVGTDTSSSGGWLKLWPSKKASTSSSTNTSVTSASTSATESFENPKLQKRRTYAQSDEFNENQFIDAGVPLGKIPKVDYKNNHLQYVVTWWGLSFASAILLVLVLKKRKIVNPMSEKLSHARRST